MNNGTSSLPLTISEWRDAQTIGDGLKRLCQLAEAELLSNPTTKAWISVATQQQLEQQWQQLQSLGPEPTNLPLYGVPFAAKDNIDVEGFPTTAACPSFGTRAATSDAIVIARLKAAGAIVIGKTNLDQFATGLVGTRSPYGAVPNSFDPLRVSGGSSSGSAVVVARGRVPFSLGTDTAGSGRVPAGLNNIVGLKPTRGALSAEGVVPACRTLDCVSIFALTVADSETVLSIAEGYDAKDSYSRKRAFHRSEALDEGFGKASLGATPSLAVCASPPWFDRDDHYPAYEQALEKARKLGWKLTPIDFTHLFQLANLLYDGPWVAERYVAIRSFIESCSADDMDPTVRGIILKAQNFSAADSFAGQYLRQELARSIQISLRSFDGLLVPTTPTFPTMDQVRQRPVEENSLLGTYTNFVNFLDWSAISVPAGFRDDELPFGVTFVSSDWQEQKLFELARQWFSNEVRVLGATGISFQEPLATNVATRPGYTPIAVVGAHLTGFPLNKDLVSRGAEFKELTSTSSCYRLYALKSTEGPKKPGLRRIASSEEGRAIEVEVWNLPSSALASFMGTISSPLGIGLLELEDKQWIHGFICEPWGVDGATDITEYGGWRGYTAHLESQVLPTTVDEEKPIRTVLVANRGEIAVRIIKTLKKMSLRAVAIYSDEDADTTHVRDADVALHLAGTTISETYRNIPQVLELAKSASADAIIPGYGFLSESADFAEAVEAAGMKWVGPTPHQMSELGLKHRARAIAVEAEVLTVPGSEKLLNSLDEALLEAEKVGYPLMLKSTAGGGGIGLRHCEDAKGLQAAFEGVQRQAYTNFGNDGVFLERFVRHARHIEVQILGDGAGKVIAAGERDCSLQRRHQKVVEESPAFAIPEEVREAIKAAAVRLASSVKYRNVGTVEFIYDVDSQDFYFLEVNTRLQVEHPITEAVTGLDLVECMLKISDGTADSLFGYHAEPIEVSGASIEVRVYAENPLQGFRPCSGTVTNLELPSNLRLDTWIQEGSTITTSYDPLLAKLIATGNGRAEALAKLHDGLASIRIKGVQTNIDYLQQIVASELFQSGEYTTKSLDSFQFTSPSIEVLEPGSLSTIQDSPGRIGYWSVGVPPSGPMDNYSHRVANRLVGNPEDAATIECTLQGPSLKFHCDSVVAITGGDFRLACDGEAVPSNQGLLVRAGQVLKIGSVANGYRAYVAIRGGIQVPTVMGSRSTLELGKIGGHFGRKLQAGDFLPVQLQTIAEGEKLPSAPPAPIPCGPNAQWTIRVTLGPHGAPEFFTQDGLSTLFEGAWKVHHNSNRLGVRLTGPRPEWARTSGGEAGLHPSNIHDSPYSIGSVSFTGDEAVVLTCDGPSLGGFVVFCVIITADMWKMGQARPGDSIRFEPIGLEKAYQHDLELETAISRLEGLSDPQEPQNGEPGFSSRSENFQAIIGCIEERGQKITIRQAGDRAVILEFGEMAAFDLRQSFQIFAFCEQHRQRPIPGVLELTPGVYTLHVIYDGYIAPDALLQRVREHVGSYEVPNQVPSRTFRLPLAFDDSVSRAAVDRYAATIRSDAPWLPSNISFLEALNGIEDISSLLNTATFLVLGLGDVFLGSPCAIPLDPRHRLFGTKYNPSRSFTPRGSVGIGGHYMCIYASDTPGGYQLVGRTTEIWDSKLICDPELSSITEGTDTNPWMFQLFDRITFYPVTETELESQPVEKLVHVSDGTLDLANYEAWLEENTDDINAAAARQAKAIEGAPFLDELYQPYEPHSLSEAVSDTSRSIVSGLVGETVRAMMPGRCYKCVVSSGDVVEQDDVLVYIESSKMEIEIRSPLSGTCVEILVKPGDLVDVYNALVVISPAL